MPRTGMRAALRLVGLVLLFPGAAFAGTWVQTTQADFAAGTATGVDVSASHGALSPSTTRTAWWDPVWSYRFRVDLAAGSIARADFPVELELDFPALMAAAAIPGTFDPASVRIVQFNPVTNVVVGEKPSWYEHGLGGKGVLFTVLDGNTAAGAVRSYHVYFDVAEAAPKPSPAYWSNTASTQVDNGTIRFGGINENQSGGSAGFSANTLLIKSSNVNTLYVRWAKLTSSLGAFGSPMTGYAGVVLAPTSFPAPISAPTTLVNSPTLQANRVVIDAGALRITQYAVLTPGHGMRMYYRYENTGGTVASDVKWWEGGDWDVLGVSATDDNARRDAGGALVTWDTASPGYAGLRGTIAYEAWDLQDRTNVMTAAQNEAPGNQPTATNLDVGFAGRFALGNIAPGGFTTLRLGFAAAPTEPLVLSALDSLATPVADTRFGVESRCNNGSGTFTSQVFDATVGNTDWTTIAWIQGQPAGTSVQVVSRAGNSAVPDASWTAFSAVYPAPASSPISHPDSRYFQYRVTLAPSAGGACPTVTEVRVNYDAPAVGLAVTEIPDPADPGVSTSLRVTALEPLGGTARTYTGTVAFTSTDASATLPGNVTFVAGDLGTKVVSGLTLRSPGPQTVTVTDTSTPSMTGGQTVNVRGLDQARARWYDAAGTALGAENASGIVIPGQQVRLRLAVRAVARSWTLTGSSYTATGFTAPNIATVTGALTATYTADGVGQELAEKKTGTGQGWRALGNPAEPGNPEMAWRFGSTIPAGVGSYSLCLRAQTTGEALNVGWTATATASAPITFPAGWQLTSTTLAETCFNLASAGYTGGPLTVYVQDALRGTDQTTDTFTIDHLYVKVAADALVGLEYASTPAFASPIQVTASEMWDVPAIANGAAIAPVLTGSTVGQVHVESRPSLPAAQVDVPLNGQAEWSFAVVAPISGGTRYYRLILTDAAGTKTGVLDGYSVRPALSTGPSQLAFTTAPQTRQAGQCSGVVTVQARDGGGLATPVGPATPVTLASTSGSLLFYSDPGCATPISQITLPAGGTQASFHFRDTTTGTWQITGTGAGMSPANQAAIIQPGALDRLSFVTASHTVAAGGCSPLVTVRTEDAYGNAAQVTASTSLTLGSSTGQVQFFSNATCATALPSPAIPAGASSLSFHFRTTLSGPVQVTAGAAGLIGTFQPHAVDPATATVLVFTTGPQTLTAGDCSAQVVLRSRDVHGNFSPVSAATPVTLGTGSGTLAFFSNPGCSVAQGPLSIPAGSSTATFYFRDTTAGSPQVTANATGFSQAAQTHSITPASGSVLAFTSAAQTLAAGACSPQLTVQSRDSLGNPAPVGGNLTVTFSSGSGTLAFYAATDTTCLTPVTTRVIASGQSQVSFRIRDTAAGTPGTTASASSYSAANQTHQVNAAAASQLQFVTAPQTLTAGDCSGVLTVRTADPFGNTATLTANLTLNLTATGTTSLAFFSNNTCGTQVTTRVIASGQSQTTFYFRDNTVGTPSTVATPASGTITPASQQHTLNPGAPTVLAFTTAPLTVTAGLCSPAVTVQTRDSNGNPSPPSANLTVTPAAATGGLTFFSNSNCATQVTTVTVNAGTTTRTFFVRSNVAGSHTLTASAPSYPQISQPFTVSAAAASQLVLLTASQTVTAGSCSQPVTVQVQDAFANPVNSGAGGRTVNLSANSGTFTFRAAAGCGGGALTSVLIPQGQSQASFFFRDNTAGTVTLTTASGTLAPANQQATIGAGTADRLVFSTIPQSVTAGLCSGTVGLRLEDALGNLAPSASPVQVGLASTSGTMTFFSDPGCATAVTQLTLAAGSAQQSFHYRDTVAGSYTVTASTAGLTPASQPALIDAAGPTQLRFTSAPVAVNAGSCSTPLTFQLEDAFGNPSAPPVGASVSLATSSAQGAFYTDATCQAPAASLVVSSSATGGTFRYRDTLAGQPDLTLTEPSLSPDTQQQTVLPGAATALAVFGVPSPAAAAIAHAFTVEARDAHGNVDAAYTGTVSFTSSDPAATLPAATAFAAQHAGSRTLSVVLGTPGTHSLSATDGVLTGAQSGIVVVPGAAASLRVSGLGPDLVSGVAASVTVEALDGAGNRSTGYAGTVRFSASDPAATLPPDAAFGAGDQGLRTLGGVVLRTSGLHQVTATDLATPSITGTQTDLRVRGAQGEACALADDCATGVCAQGVCCDRTCGSACEACDVAGSVGTCGPALDGTGCANGVHCDGVETCLAGACVSGAPVTCIDPLGEQALACDEAQQACVPVPDAPPLVVRDAFLFAAVGVPYAYNAQGRVRAVGTLPMTFAACGGPWTVEPATGAVSWMPAATGTVDLCVRATNAFGQDEYAFTVAVSIASGAPPTAAFTVTPDDGSRVTLFELDGFASTADPATPLVAWRWDFGDASPPAYGEGTTHGYPVPGGYVMELTVVDQVGRTATARRPLAVRDDEGLRPPTAQIVASALSGEGELEVTLSCDCQPGDGALALWRWDLPEAPVFGPQIAATLPPGRHRVQLTVVDVNGLSARDTVELVVGDAGNAPPSCRVYLDPPAGEAPLGVTHLAAFGDAEGPVQSHVLTFADGTTSTGIREARTYAEPARYPVTLVVRDADGLTCVDRAEVTALAAPGGKVPPRILSAPERTAACGVPWRYGDPGPIATGDGPLSWSVEPASGVELPEGLSVDEATGELTWLPTSDRPGAHAFVLRVDGPGGVGRQLVEVDVACGGPRELVASCGCGSAGGGAAGLAALAFALLLLSSGRRRAPKSL